MNLCKTAGFAFRRRDIGMNERLLRWSRPAFFDNGHDGLSRPIEVVLEIKRALGADKARRPATCETSHGLSGRAVYQLVSLLEVHFSPFQCFRVFEISYCLNVRS